MPNIVHRIGIEGTTAERVYQAVATRDGIASWWTEDVNGESTVGSVLQFRFGKGGPDFQVLELAPPTRVRWKCVAAGGVDRYAHPLRYQPPKGRRCCCSSIAAGGSRIHITAAHSGPAS